MRCFRRTEGSVTDSTNPLLERDQALRQIGAAVDRGKHLLVHGPAGIGKTALVRAALAQTRRRPLICRSARTGADIYRAALAEAVLGGFSLPASLRPGLPVDAAAIAAWPSLRCRGLLEQALRAGNWCLVLDPAPQASRTLAHALQELLRFSGTPLLCCADSPHMEDIGYLSVFFLLKSDQLRVEPLSEAAALQLCEMETQRLGLSLDEPRDARNRLLQLAQGRPGVLLRLLQMARLPRYRSGGVLKTSLLYVDFRMGGLPGGRQ